MTGFQNVAPEQLARLFFHYREALAQDFDCAWADYGASSCWETAPSNERKLLVASARLVLMELASNSRREEAAEDGTGKKDHASNGWVEGTEGKECGC